MTTHDRALLAPRARRAGALLLTAALLASCGGGGGGDDEADTTTTTAAPTTAAPTTAASAETEPAPTTEGGEAEEPAVEAASEGEVVLEEPFDDDSNQWGPENYDDEFATGAIDGGFLTFSQSASFVETLPEGQVAGPGLFWPSAVDDLAPDLTAVRVEVIVSLSRGGAAGVACGIDPTGDDERFYAFTLSSAGVVAIQKYESDGSFGSLVQAPEVDADDPRIPEGGPVEYDEDAVYELAGECTTDGDGTTLTFEVDGTVVLQHVDADDPIPSGTAGLQYSESSLLTRVEGFEPFGIAFDDWRLIDLAGGGGGGEGGGEEVGASIAAEDWEAEADQICLDAEDAISDLGDPPADPADGADLAAAALPVYEATHEALADLGEPDEGAGEVEAFLDLLQENIDITEAYVGHAQQGDGPATADALAEAVLIAEEAEELIPESETSSPECRPGDGGPFLARLLDLLEG